MPLEMDITVYSFQTQGSKEKCIGFLKAINDAGLKPLKYGSSERARHSYENENQLIDYWTRSDKCNYGIGIVVIRGKGFYALIKWGGAKPYCTWIKFSVTKQENWDAILKFAQALFTWNGAVYGYVELESETNQLSTPGCNILDCLGGIAWGNLFGKPYVDMWSKQKMLDAPAWKTKILDNNGVMIVTTKSPLVESADAKALLKTYLGNQCFYNHPESAPKLITREELYQSVFGNYNKIQTNYVAPDFAKLLEPN